MTENIKKYSSFDSLNQFEKNTCNFIIETANKSIQEKDSFSIVLCGGSTPKNIYSKLKKEATDWSKWHVFFGDERCFPKDHSSRNSLMAKEIFLDDVPIPRDQIHYIQSELGNKVAANLYNDLLKKIGFFDLVLLGFGEDGHIASLFPDHYWDNTIDVVPIFDAPKPPSDRISITARRLSQTEKVLFIISGKNKNESFKRWQIRKDLPASLISARKEVVIYTYDVI